MNLMRLVVTVVVLVMVAAQLARPTPARADTPTALVIAGAVTAAYVGVVIIATAVQRRSRGPFELMPAETERRRKGDQPRVHFGVRCAQTPTALTLVCW